MGNKEMVKKTKTIFVFEIDGKHWTLIMTEAVFMDMFTGKMNPQTGFMQGKYKIKGNLMVRISLFVTAITLASRCNAKLRVICCPLLSLLSSKFSPSPLIILFAGFPKAFCSHQEVNNSLAWLADLSYCESS